MAGITRPHPPCIQHHGVQDYAIEDELETVHDRSMTATENLKPAKAMHTKHQVKDDGSLSNLSLSKLDKSLSAFAAAARDMEAQLIIATTNSHIISHGLVQRFAAVKCELDAESAALQLYKENNREEDTAELCKTGLAQLAAARNNFKVLEKMLSAVKTP